MNKQNLPLKTQFQIAYFLTLLGIFVAYIDFEKTVYGYSVKKTIIIGIFLVLFNMLREVKEILNSSNK